MNSGYIDSYYAATANAPGSRPALAGDLEVDVCVIGGGFTGASAALHLAERGYSVALLEAERVGWGASGRNGGHVGVGQRKGQEELEKIVDPAIALACWELGLEAVALVKELVTRHNIACDLKQGILHVAAKPSHVKDLRSTCTHLQQKYHYEDVRFVERQETAQMLGTEKYFAGQLESGAAHLHPLNYVLGLGAAAESAGTKIFEHSRVTGFDGGASPRVQTDGGSVRAKYVVIGCNGYLEKLSAPMARKIMPINNFVLATEPLPATQAAELIRDDVAVQDTLFVLSYWKLSGDNRLLFGGGETYTKRFPHDLKKFVRKYMLRVYPQLEGTRIDYAWGGTLAITMNRLPSFGRLSDNIFFAQGYSGHGVPTATLAGKLLAEAVAGTAERFDVMANLPTPTFPGGTLLRWPGMVLGLVYYGLRDKL
ncbi:MAG: FAD-binding oxidoreductase [Gammaproteobacteria bacterium]|nr:FAD-binding oxidoreductase [Gammaproteobacteria bacterium]